VIWRFDEKARFNLGAHWGQETDACWNLKMSHGASVELAVGEVIFESENVNDFGFNLFSGAVAQLDRAQSF
jgi:hypothetical protein